MKASVIQGCFPAGLPHSLTALRTPHAVQLSSRVAPFPSGGGRPLMPAVLQKMESLFGVRLRDVRVHVGPHVAAIGAQAFTQGNDIHFAPGHYNPATPAGQQLLARQLAHVVQQRAGRVVNPFGAGVAVVRNALLDREAEEIAAEVAQPYLRFGRAHLGKNSPPVKRARAFLQGNENLGALNEAAASDEDEGTLLNWLKEHGVGRGAASVIVKGPPKRVGHRPGRRPGGRPSVTAPVRPKDWTAKNAAIAMIRWIKSKSWSKDTNYTVASLTNGNLVISKVGGVTGKTKAIAELVVQIKATGWNRGRRIYLAQKYSTAVTASNHAEMCILAAVGNPADIEYMLCTSPNCDFCKKALKKYGVTSGNDGTGRTQMGWVHPFLPVAYGLQLSTRLADQLSELENLPAAITAGDITYGQWCSSAPAGRSVELAIP